MSAGGRPAARRFASVDTVRGRLGWVLTLLVACVVSVAEAPAARGDDAPAVEEAKSAAEAAAPKDPTPLDLEDQILESRAAPWVLGALWVAALLGVVFLVRLYLRWDRIRGGMIAPPPRVVPTTPFPPLPAIGLFVLPMVATVLLARGAQVLDLLPESGAAGHEGFGPELPWTLGIQIAAGLPVVVWIVLRRNRPAVPRPPRLPRAAAIGGWTWCVVLVAAVPAALLSTLLLKHFGVPTPPQPLVDASRDPSTPDWLPWVVAGYGVVFAPVMEESLFRGLLYPAIRSAAGGGRTGMWTAVLVTAVLFAAVHLHVPSLLPLFALALVLALVFEHTNSLAAVMVAHGLFNLGSMSTVLLVRFGL